MSHPVDDVDNCDGFGNVDLAGSSGLNVSEPRGRRIFLAAYARA